MAKDNGITFLFQPRDFGDEIEADKAFSGGGGVHFSHSKKLR
jgi:hypothetical protein